MFNVLPLFFIIFLLFLSIYLVIFYFYHIFFGWGKNNQNCFIALDNSREKKILTLANQKNETKKKLVFIENLVQIRGRAKRRLSKCKNKKKKRREKSCHPITIAEATVYNIRCENLFQIPKYRSSADNVNWFTAFIKGPTHLTSNVVIWRCPQRRQYLEAEKNM